MSYQYFVTAHKPTAVTVCATGQFTSENHLNLILAKNSRVEILLVGPEGLRLMKEVSVHGRIVVMKLFRFPNENKDLLFIVTSKFNVMILSCQGDQEKIDISTKAHGNIADKIGEVSDSGIIGVIDPKSKIIGLRLYDGLLKLILLEKEITELRAMNIRIEESEIQDLNFLYGCENPTLILLYQNIQGRHLKSYEISVKEGEFIKANWRQDNLTIEASFVIAVPDPVCGVIVIGQDSILYVNGMINISVEPAIIRRNSITCYAKLDPDGCRYVLGDLNGHLFMLLLERECELSCTTGVKHIIVELLGEVSIPECITYLDNGVLFIGSRLGDSQLVKLNSGINSETESYVTIMDTFTNLAPIIDMVVVDLEKQGQAQLVTCSGGRKEGSLRIIRNGIGIQELATFEMSGIKGIWALNVRSLSGLDNTLVLSFVGHTRILSFGSDEIEETEIIGFQSDFPTMYCGNVTESAILQVIPDCIRLISVFPVEELLSEWKTLSGKNISLVTSNTYQIVCASGKELYYLEICENEIVLKTSLTLEFEVSCLDISPFPGQDYSEFIAVGLWSDISTRILRVPSLAVAHTEFLGGDIISRSILFATFENTFYFLCGLGDGSMIYFNFDRTTGQLSERKRVTLGTQPLILKSFRTMDVTNVFVCSDRPTVIYSSNHKLVFSNVNLKEVNCMCLLNSDTYPESLALSTESMVLIGTIDEIQKLHIRSVPLGETPRRIAYQESSETFGIISTRMAFEGLLSKSRGFDCASIRAQNITNSQQSSLLINKGDGENYFPDICLGLEVYNFLLLDQHTFEVIHAHQMMPSEFCLSLISAKLGLDHISYYIVGTAIVKPGESEPKHGRILMFSVEDGKLQQTSEKELKGACYSLVEFNGKLLACINSTVRLFQWTDDKKLKLECSHFNNITALYSKTKGDFVLIGDIMRAITLLRYKSIENTFEEISRDYNPKWMTAVEILDDDTFLGAENSFNLFVCQKDSSTANDEERQQMQEVAQFHLGDLVNIFRHGSLVMHHMLSSVASLNGTVLLGTVSGLVGVVIQISQELYELLQEIQKKLSIVIAPIGKIEHSYWRSFSNEVRSQPAEGFIDGDLIECFLDLPRKTMMDIIGGLQIHNGSGMKEDATIDDIIKIVEDLTRIH